MTINTDAPALVPIAQYAEKQGLTANAIRRRCIRGTMPGAIKMGRDWFVPVAAQITDNRVKSGNYKNWRKEKPAK